MPTMTQPASAGSVAKARIIEPEGTKFRDDFDRNSFIFSHNLAGHPLFELPRLTALAETLLKHEGPSATRWKNSTATVDAKWGQLPPSEQIASVTEAIQNLDQSGSWVVLYRVQNDPEYRALLEQSLDEIEGMLGRPLRPDITWKDSYIFLASPHALTPYHIDHETAFLLQVHGNRVAHLWDQKDRAIVTDTEIEEYYMGDIGSANYSEKKMEKAYRYEMEAGKGVHHPSLAPHTYKNGDTYSVAIGIHLCLKNTDDLARVYQFNACLRRLGLRSTPPGGSSGRDRMKIKAVRLFDKKKPKNKYELIRSGAIRIKECFRLLNKLKGKKS
ncbi:MAG: hypothetical protein LV480_06675 [Methylacidiphilales bacterium]|nr:hypothetical protein [Candidatus Methylacidiphilales bacterium]